MSSGVLEQPTNRQDGDGYLTTTEVAAILGYSRQHIVKMCDSGQLPHIRHGSHRRIRRSDLVPFLPHQEQPVRREDEQSLWLNYVYAAKLVQDPNGVIERAKQRLERLRHSHNDGSSERYLDAWQAALDAGPDAVLEIMLDRGERGQAMRSASPLSGLGLLSDDERVRVRTSARAHWQASHQQVSHDTAAA
jgi:excisionase family DNA binding protein